MHSAFCKNGLAGAALLATLFVAGCASMADTPPGTPLAQVRAQYGQPSYTCTTDTGQQRVIWSTQPMGQVAWGANIDANGNIDQITQLLTNANFRKLDTGRWDSNKVSCEYGPPAEIAPVGLPASRQQVWSYRYKESGAWNSLMHVYFDPNTGVVTRHHPGPDPMYQREWFMFQ